MCLRRCQFVLNYTFKKIERTPFVQNFVTTLKYRILLPDLVRSIYTVQTLQNTTPLISIFAHGFSL
jgi:hypothetical protein